MPPEERQHISMFRSDDWRVWTETLFDTMGVSVAVADLAAGMFVHSGPRGPYCHTLHPGDSRPEVVSECFDAPPWAAGDSWRSFCRSGFACYFQRVEGADPELHVVIAGFVTSTRERRRLFEQLLARGASEAQARQALVSVPVISHKRAASIAFMVATHAAATIAAARDREAALAAGRAVAATSSAFRALVDGELAGEQAGLGALALAIALVGAEGGTLRVRRPGSDLLEVVAASGGRPSGTVGSLSRVGEGPAGHAAATGRSVVVASGMDPSEGASLCSPVFDGDSLTGVFELSFPREVGPVQGRVVDAIEEFAKLVGPGLRFGAAMAAGEREFARTASLVELARLLQGDVAAEDVVRLVGEVLEKSVDLRIGGIVLSGHAQECASLFARGDVGAHDIAAVTEEASGVAIVPSAPTARVVVREGDLLLGDERVCEEWTVLSVPLTVRDVGIGALFVASDRPGDFDASVERLLWQMSAQVGPALDRAALFGRLRDDYTRALAALSTALDASERREAGHSKRVMDYAVALGEEIGLVFEEVEALRFAGLLHDIGKVGVSEEILLKPSKLSEGEMDRVMMHSQIGASLLEQVEFLNAVAPIVLHHHERWDGEGYPMRLTGEDIPLAARILAVADAYDSMTSDSAYRAALPPMAARAELERGAGSQFDPAVVAAMSRILDAQVAAGMTGLLAVDRREERRLPM